jgi:FKBP-type peptidyl-prolyl cis-trans isomerase FklB
MKISFHLAPVIAIALLTASCNAQDKKNAGAMKTPLDSVSYSLGVSIGNNFKTNQLDSINVDALARGMKDALSGKTEITQEQADQRIQEYMAEREKVKGAESLQKGKAFLEANKSKEGVKTTPSGLQYIVMKEGTGPKPGLNDKVTTHYHGTLVDGTVFDSSVDRGQPATFPVSGVIPGWTEALQMMPVGSKWKLFVPSELAYGDRGAGGKIPGNSVLIFEVELLKIEAPETK